MGRRPKDEMAALEKAARQHLKRANALGDSLDLRITKKQKASDEFTMNEDDRRDFAAITTAIQHAGKSLTQALEAKQKALGELTEAQLEHAFQTQLVKSATSISDEDWETMVAARTKARNARQ